MVRVLTSLPQLQSSRLGPSSPLLCFLLPSVVPPLPFYAHSSQAHLQETGPVAKVTSWLAGSFHSPLLSPLFSLGFQGGGMCVYGERGGGLLSLGSSGVGQKKLGYLSSKAP